MEIQISWAATPGITEMPLSLKRDELGRQVGDSSSEAVVCWKERVREFIKRMEPSVYVSFEIFHVGEFPLLRTKISVDGREAEELRSVAEAMRKFEREGDDNAFLYMFSQNVQDYPSGGYSWNAVEELTIKFWGVEHTFEARSKGGVRGRHGV